MSVTSAGRSVLSRARLSIPGSMECVAQVQNKNYALMREQTLERETIEMKLNRKHFALSAIMTAFLTLTGCSSTAAQGAPATPDQNKAPNSETGQNSQAQKESKTAKSDQTTTDTTKEDKNDDIELENLNPVTGHTISLTDAKGNLLINKGGTYTLNGSTSYTVVVDAKDQDVTLVLDSAAINAKDLPAIYVRNAKKTIVEVKGSSTLNSTSHTAQDGLNAALYVRSDLDLKGTGTLTIKDGEGHGVKAKGDMTSQALTLTATASQDGLHASDNLTITSGIYTFKTEDEGIEVNEALNITDGTFTIKSTGDGLRAETGVVIKNGKYTIDTENEGIESKADLTIENGTFTINAKDDGLNAGNDLTVKGGTLNIISSTNDGLDANGNLDLAGGTINTTALKAPEGAFDVDNAKFTISGGNIIGLSAVATLPTDVKQNTVMVNAESTFKKLELKQGGKTLLSFENKAQTETTQNNTAKDKTSQDPAANQNNQNNTANKDSSNEYAANQQKQGQNAPEQEMTNTDRRGGQMGPGGMNGNGTIALTLSCKDLKAGSEAQLYLDGQLAETFTVEEGLTTVGDIMTMGGGAGGMRGGEFGGRPEMNEDFDPNGQRPEMDKNFDPNGERPELPEDFDGRFPFEDQDGNERPQRPEFDQNQDSQTQDNRENFKGQKPSRNRGQGSTANDKTQEDTTSSATSKSSTAA